MRQGGQDWVRKELLAAGRKDGGADEVSGDQGLKSGRCRYKGKWVRLFGAGKHSDSFRYLLGSHLYPCSGRGLVLR